MFEFTTNVLQYTGTQPTRAHQDDAGLDLYVHGNHTVEPGQMADLDLGVAIKSPPNCWVLLTGRSSTMRNRGLLVAQGVIDPGYTGPLYATVHNLTQQTVYVQDGDRIAQLIVLPNLTQYIEPVQVSALPDTERGTKGFGSSGL